MSLEAFIKRYLISWSFLVSLSQFEGLFILLTFFFYFFIYKIFSVFLFFLFIVFFHLHIKCSALFLIYHILYLFIYFLIFFSCLLFFVLFSVGMDPMYPLLFAHMHTSIKINKQTNKKIYVTDIRFNLWGDCMCIDNNFMCTLNICTHIRNHIFAYLPLFMYGCVPRIYAIRYYHFITMQ